ncbi:MAG: four helix bundle protein [Nitrospinae bacterium]|nr:four helix bundle protein [Nitrospinota bacterium]
MGKPHKRLEVWKRSISFVEQIASFPSEEKFGLLSQMRRAAVSIPSNIAELETQIIISKNLQLLESRIENSLLEELDEISKMIIGLQRSLRSTN